MDAVVNYARRSQKLPPCLRESMPADCKTALQGKGKLLGNGGSACGMTDLRRRGQNCSAKAAGGKRSSSADTKVSGEGGSGGASVAESEIPLQSVVQTMVKQLCAHSPW